MSDWTTEEANARNRLDFLERFVVKIRDWLDTGKDIQSGSEAHGQIKTVTGYGEAQEGPENG